jgi:hypothetical protein
MNQPERWFAFKFILSESQAEVVRHAVARVIDEVPLSGKNLRGRALELICADSLNSPIESYR